MTDLPDDLGRAMVSRSHEADGCLSRVWYSGCDRYRYGLSRVWDAARPSLLFIMLNPSTADEFRNDPTVARCEIRARRMGFGAMMVANLFAFRATRPADLKRAQHPVGDLNDAVLRHWADRADTTIAAWGVHGTLLDRARQVSVGLPAATRHLGLTKAGHPRHPLYVALDTEPAEWRPEERYAEDA